MQSHFFDTAFASLQKVRFSPPAPQPEIRQDPPDRTRSPNVFSKSVFWYKFRPNKVKIPSLSPGFPLRKRALPCQGHDNTFHSQTVPGFQKPKTSPILPIPLCACLCEVPDFPLLHSLHRPPQAGIPSFPGRF